MDFVLTTPISKAALMMEKSLLKNDIGHLQFPLGGQSMWGSSTKKRHFDETHLLNSEVDERHQLN